MEDSSHLEEELFQAALERPAGERAEFLAAACAGDVELLNRVLELLAAHGRAEGFMEPANADLTGPGSLGSHLQQPPDSVGPYKLLEKIGEGGCGVVYKAEQQHPIRRVVAVKIIKLGMDTRSVIARFQAERQALAMMDHPNIAKVLDAGTTESGRPYFVMELVSGARITRYCDENQLPTTQRLNLFIQICNAVQHAHQKGIIHRDIKPSNILVTQHDGIAVPKIIDFGIAKATQGRLADHTDFTAIEQFIGTPAYMSPEQAEVSGIDVDTRSDIYSLGVLLYELLTGRTPFELGDAIKTGLDEMRRRIREDEPIAPSTRLSALEGDSATTVANFRLTDPPRLIRSIRGDLDWIVLKCLEKDRSRRYETANGLAAEIQRHLNSEPVVARPAGRVYRFRKMVRRNKLAFAATMIVMFVILAAAAMSTWQAMRATRAERVAQSQKGLADQLRRKAQDTAAELKKNLYYAQMNLCGPLLASPSGIGQLDALLAPWRSEPDLRGPEWYFANALAHQEILTLPYHPNLVSSLAWSPDGRMIASGSTDRAIDLCDAQTGMLIKKLRGQQAGILSLAWSPDGTRLAAGASGADPVIRIWDVSSGKVLQRFPGHTNNVFGLSWEPTGARLASCSGDGMVKIWDVTNSKWELDIHLNLPVLAVAWCPTASRIACGLTDGHVQVIDPDTGTVQKSPKVVGARVAAVAWSPDGKQLAWTGNSPSIVLWKVDGEEDPKGYNGHRTPLTSIAWSPDGKTIATASSTQFTVGLVDPTNGKLIRELPGHAGPLHAVAWSPDSRHIASASADHTVKIWDISRNMEMLPLTINGAMNQMVWSPDGRRLAGGGSDKTIRIWSLEEGDKPEVLKGHDDQVRALAWSPNGKLLASAGDDNLVKLWNPTGGPSQDLRGHALQITSVAWNPDSSRLASADVSGIVRIWSADPPEEKFNFNCFGTSGSRVAWSADGRTLATTANNGYVRTWDAAAGTFVRTFYGRSVPAESLAWSPTSRQFAVSDSDGTVQVFDADTGERLAMLRGHTSAIRQVQWSPDGKRLLTGSLDHTMRIWDARTGEQLLTLPGPPPGVWTVAWSPDMLRLACAGPTSPAQVYDATIGYAIERAPSIIPELQRQTQSMPDDAHLLRLLLEACAAGGKWDQAAETANKLLSIGQAPHPAWYETGWWLAGPYPNSLNADFSSRLGNADPSQSLSSENGSRTEWRRFPFGAAGYVDPRLLFPDFRNSCVYALSKFYVPKACSATIHFRCECQTFAWLNGKPLSTTPILIPTTRPSDIAEVDADATQVNFQQGWNMLLVRIVRDDSSMATVLSSTANVLRPDTANQPELFVSTFAAPSNGAQKQ